MNLWRILQESGRRWWYEWPSLLLLGYGWFLAQLLVIPGPPATAVLFGICREKGYWGVGDVWHLFRQLFWASWWWGAAYLFITTILAVNLWFFTAETAVLWHLLRLLWLASLFVWFGLNCIYWPFWFSQQEKSWRQTIQNCGKFWLLHPLTALCLTLLTVIVGLVSLLALLPLMLGSIPWLALCWLIAAEHSMKLTHQSFS